MPRRPPAVARVLERVTATIREHDMVSPGDRVLVAVSGGPDSVCLLYSLHMLRRLFRIKLEVFHFDHMLRKDSHKDAQYVRRLAERLRVPFHLVVAESKPPKGESVEAWARRQRLTAALAVARDEEIERIALGHTLDDQAETVLLALIYGRGLDGVAGMRPVDGSRIRPLLETRRTDIEAFCHALGLRPRLDPTNKDRSYLRNAIRHEVIPAMERSSGRDVKGPIARSAYLLAQELDVVRRPGPVRFGERIPGGYRFRAGALRSLPGVVASRLVKEVVIQLKVDPGKAQIDAVLNLAAGRPGRRRDLPGGLLAVRDREYVRLSRASPESPSRRSKGEPK